MTSRDLFELASLDVLGLLDEQERVDFEQAFRAAPPHVQAQIRTEQLRFSDVDRLLPAVHPPAGLRARVVAAVRDAIASVQTEPLARIGAGARSGFAVPMWRAACIGFATASLVLGGFAWHMSRTVANVTLMANSNGVFQELSRASSPDFVHMLSRQTIRHVAFSPAAKDYDGRAAAGLYVDTATRVAYLVCRGMPVDGGSYRLIVEDPTSGSATALKEFSASAGTFFVALQQVDPASVHQLKIQAPKPDGTRAETLLVASGV